MFAVTPNSTSVIVTPFALIDASGNGVTTFAAADIAALSYTRPGFAPVSVTPVNLASATALYASGGIYLVAEGQLRIDLPDGAYAAGVRGVAVRLKGTAGQTLAALSPTILIDASVGSLNDFDPATDPVANVTLAATQAFDNTGQTARLPIADPNYTTTTYIAAASGTTKATIEAAASGTLVLLGPGTHTITAGNIITVPAGVVLQGAGMGATTISFNATTIGLLLNENVRVRDMTVVNTSATGKAIGANIPTAFANVLLERVRAVGNEDGMNISSTGVCSGTAINCIFESGFDAIKIASSGCAWDLIGCELIGTGTHADGICQGLIVDLGTVRMFDCNVRTVSTNALAMGTVGIAASGASSRVEMYGGSVYVEAPAGEVYSLQQLSSAKVIVAGTQYDPSLTSGTILGHAPLQPTTIGRRVNVSATGVADAQVKGIAANAITAASVAAAALDDKGNWMLATSYTAPDNAGITAISNRATELRLAKLDRDLAHAADANLYKATGFATTEPDNTGIAAIAAKLSGMTSFPAWLRAIFRKDAPDATAAAEINAGATAGTYDPTTDSQEAIRDRGDLAWLTGAGGGGGGAGAYAITVPVTDVAMVPLTGAIVRMTKGAETFVAMTSATGESTFALDVGTYTLTATADGYEVSPTSYEVLVNATTPTLVMSLVVSPMPTDPLRCAVAAKLVDGKGNVVPGGSITLTLRNLAAGGSGFFADLESFVLTANSSGILIADLLRGATYAIRSGDGSASIMVVPDSASYEAASIRVAVD